MIAKLRRCASDAASRIRRTSSSEGALPKRRGKKSGRQRRALEPLSVAGTRAPWSPSGIPGCSALSPRRSSGRARR